MRTTLILPIGITKDIVHGILNDIKDSLIGIITVTTKGFEEAKHDIIQGVRAASELIGAKHYHLEVEFGDREASAKLYNLLKELGTERIVISGITGSRYLYPIIMQATLRYWYDTGAEAALIHGIEGEKWELVPLTGFLTYDLKREQRNLFMLIYSIPKEVLKTKEDLIDKHGFTRTVYKVLAKLEERGLIKHSRNKIEKTLPGYLLFNILKVAGGGYEPKTRRTRS